MAKFKTNFRQFIFSAGSAFISAMLICLLPSFSAPDLNTVMSSGANTEAISTTVHTAVTINNTKTKTTTTTTTTANKIADSHIVATTLERVFKADDAQVWNVLVDFKKYPTIFKRIQSVEITKRDGQLVYTECHLKPGIFVQRAIQHTVNDLTAAPKILNWHMLDGNFKYLKGKWELQQRTANTCLVKYTLYVDLGPIVPAALINFVVHHVQQEIVADLKHYVEAEYTEKDKKRSLSNTINYRKLI